MNKKTVISILLRSQYNPKTIFCPPFAHIGLNGGQFFYFANHPTNAIMIFCKVTEAVFGIGNNTIFLRTYELFETDLEADDEDYVYLCNKHSQKTESLKKNIKKDVIKH